MDRGQLKHIELIFLNKSLLKKLIKCSKKTINCKTMLLHVKSKMIVRIIKKVQRIEHIEICPFRTRISF